MAYQIHLSESDQIDFVQSLLWSLESKTQVIRDPVKFRRTQALYSDAAQKFLEPVVIHQAHNNLFVWMEDQICHSPGVRDTDLGRRVIRICAAVKLNQYTPETQFSRIFSTDRNSINTPD